jgi:hypothetical protein
MQIIDPGERPAEPIPIQARTIKDQEFYFPDHLSFTWAGDLDDTELNRCNEQAALSALADIIYHLNLSPEARAKVRSWFDQEEDDANALHHFIMGSGELEVGE